MKRLLLSISVALICSAGLYAREYHVAKTGSDQNDGSAAAPFLTINKAAMVLKTGDTVTVHQGVYREWVQPRNSGADVYHRITYRAAEGEEVWIKGSEEVKGWQRQGRTDIWKVVLPNSFFGDFNPFAEPLVGDWLSQTNGAYVVGDVFINNKSLFQAITLEGVSEPVIPRNTRKPEDAKRTWYVEVTDTQTTIWANFGPGVNPNNELVEVTSRPAVFFPALPGVNYITVKGFHLSQAATNWAPPTAFQQGLIGPHWSKGWIIEDNVISNSKCVGISLGKDRQSGQNRWTIERTLSGFNRELEVIFQAEDMGWKKENIGSHIIRNNEIFDCEQAGIVGHLGCVFSIIENNYIHDCNAKRQYSGAEVGCIKLHAAIDVIVRNNVLENGYNGLWLDWQGIGTRVTGNVFFNNDHTDIWTEVTHGPCLIDNNVLLSPDAFLEWGQGAAFVHNIISGYITFHPVQERYTPYHAPHSTKIVGVMNFPGGDDRYYNNIFTIAPDSKYDYKDAGTSVYNERPPYYDGIYTDMSSRNITNPLLLSFNEQMAAGNSQPPRFQLAMRVANNVYYNGVKPYAYETNPVTSGNDAKVSLEKRADGIYVKITVDGALNRAQTELMGTNNLGKTYYSNGYYENPDGTPLVIDKDFFGNARSSKPVPGPFENIRQGENEFCVWKF